MKIALTRSESRFNIYTDWLKHHNIEFEVLDYESKTDEISKLDGCSGLILTGGADILPELYCDLINVYDEDNGKNSIVCGTYIRERDDFEMKVIEYSIKKNLPILAICRGLQIMNVYFRGSLISDLMEIKNVNHDRISESEGRLHNINVLKNTLLHEIVKTDVTEVNSYHHQAIDTLGDNLMINSRSEDGIIEGIEYSDKKDKLFFIGIQWHPERFKNMKDPASESILIYFINECKKV